MCAPLHWTLQTVTKHARIHACNCTRLPLVHTHLDRHLAKRDENNQNNNTATAHTLLDATRNARTMPDNIARLEHNFIAAMHVKIHCRNHPDHEQHSSENTHENHADQFSMNVRVRNAQIKLKTTLSNRTPQSTQTTRLSVNNWSHDTTNCTCTTTCTHMCENLVCRKIGNSHKHMHVRERKF